MPDDTAPRLPEWGPPDGSGVRTLWLDDPGRSTLRGRRQRQALASVSPEVDVWPRAWREVATAWVRKADSARALPFERLLVLAGERQANAVHPVLDTLFRQGALRIEEHRDARGWSIRRVWFIDPSALRGALGLAEPDADRVEWSIQRERPLSFDDLQQALATLDASPPRVALARLSLLNSLQRWRQEGRHLGLATRRDFAWFARGTTKSISPPEWQWLEANLELERDGISAHAPLLMFGSDMRLRSARGLLDCSALGTFMALPPAAVETIDSIEAIPDRWTLIENRSAFEHHCRARAPNEAVLWLPGYPPRWWVSVVDCLLALAPAPACIACDPDPDGLRIAMTAGNLWQARGINWTPWRMSAEELASLRHRRPLGERDRTLLADMLTEPLPSQLRKLACWMLDHGEKGEQEALFG